MTKNSANFSLADLVRAEDTVGSLISLSYHEAYILTNDFRQISVGGLPKNAFLTVPAPDEQGELNEIFLLQVTGPEPLITQRELVQVREELAAQQVNQATTPLVDRQLEARLGTQAFRCRVLGTFYRGEDGKAYFGADVDNVRGSNLLQVYRPQGESLGLIASFSNTQTAAAAQIEVGKVRYTETRKKIDTAAAVHINVEDFLGTKTFLCGLTRSGKSNSMKIILQKIHKYSRENGSPVAQLVLDPQGEYASTNSQDGEALANIGDASEVSIYKIMEKTSDPRERHLQFDLFAEENLELTYKLIVGELEAGVSGGANYISKFLNLGFLPLGENAEMKQRIHYNRKKMALFALMYEGLGRQRVKPFTLSLPESAMDTAKDDSELKMSAHKKTEVLIDSTASANRVAKLLLEAKSSGNLNESWEKEFQEDEAGIILEQLIEIYERGRNGVRAAIARVEPLHASDSEGDVRENVWRDIQLGKLIVIDLSKGSPQTSQILSELIVNYLLDKASELFTGGKPPTPFQIVVEEAHNLFERDGKRNERDPWVRISKEASKYQIGLVYATQEVSSVDKRILSNTTNWLVSALNSVKETKELANYYQFADWEEHIRRIETKGFVRLKTQSSPYIIPVQIERFQADTASTKIKKSESRKSVTDSSPDDDKSSDFAELEF